MLDYLITGGNGFIGKNLCNALDEFGKSYKVVDTDPCHDNDTVCIDTSFRMPYIEADTIVHLASLTNVRSSIKYPTDTIEKNCKSILNCLESLKKGNANSLIFTSSASAQASSSPYLASKSSCESFCNAYKESYVLDIHVLKLSNVYGPYSTHKSSVIPLFIKSCLENSDIVIYGDGLQKRDFIHVNDVVDSILERKDGFVSSGILSTIISLAFLISDLSEELIGYKPRIHHEQPIIGEIRDPIVKTDIEPKINLQDGIRSTFEWFRRNYEVE